MRYEKRINVGYKTSFVFCAKYEIFYFYFSHFSLLLSIEKNITEKCVCLFVENKFQTIIVIFLFLSKVKINVKWKKKLCT